MRSIGAAQVALDTMIRRVTDSSRKTFGKFLYEHGRSPLLILLPSSFFGSHPFDRHGRCGHCEIPRRNRIRASSRPERCAAGQLALD